MPKINPVNQNSPSGTDIPLKKIKKEKPSVPAVPNYTEPISEKLLSHVQADFFIENSGLEGNTQDDSLLYMIDVFKQIAKEIKHKKLKNLISAFEESFDLVKMTSQIPLATADEVAEKIRGKIQKLEPGGRIFIPGGWTGRPSGHAMFYALQKQENGKYTLLTFNTGGGINYFHDTKIDARGYARYAPIVRYVDIEEKELLKPHRLKNLVDLMCTPFDSGAEYAPMMIYDSILPSFGGRLENPPSMLTRAIRGQRGGTCSWKVLMAMSRVCLEESGQLPLFKSLKIALRIENLKKFLSQNETLTLSQYYNLSNDIENIYRALKKKDLGLDKAEVSKKFNELKKIRKKVEEKRVLEDSEVKRVGKFQFGEESLAKVESDAVITPLADEVIRKKTVAKRLSVSLSSERPPKEAVKDHLAAWLQQVEQLYGNGQYEDVIYYVNEIVKNLPFPIPTIKGEEARDGYWGSEGERKPEEIREIIVALSKLNEYLFKSCFQQRGCRPQEKLTAAVSCAIEVKLLENLVGYQRGFPHDTIAGFGMSQSHEANYTHFELAVKSNEFQDDMESKAKMQEFIKLFFMMLPYRNATKLFTRETNFDKFSEEGRKRIEEIQNSLYSKAFEREIYTTTSQTSYEFIDDAYQEKEEEVSSVDKRLLFCLCLADMGNFDLCPDFLIGLNKQFFITSYYFGQNNFASRSMTVNPDDAFSIVSYDEDRVKKIVKEQDYQPEDYILMGVKGGGNSSRVESSGKIQTKFSHTFSNPFIQEFVDQFLSRNSSLNPNLSLVEFSKHKALPPSIVKELLTFLNTSENIILWQLFGFFLSNPELLDQNDFRNLFELIYSTHLENELRNKPKMAKKIQKMLLELKDECTSRSQTEAALFMMRQEMILEKIVDGLKSEGIKSKTLRSMVFENCEELLKKRIIEAKNSGEKNALQAQLAYYIAHHNKEMSREKFQDAAIGLALFHAGKVPESMAGANFISTIEYWMKNREEEIKSLMRDNDGSFTNAVCNASFSSVSGKESSLEWNELEFPLYQSVDGKCRINILTSEIVIEDSSVAAIPRKMLQNPYFHSLFGKEVLSGRLEGFDRYHFIHKGGEYRVELKLEGNCIIEQKIGGIWFQFVPQDWAAGHFPPLLVKEHSHWHSTDPKGDRIIYIQDKNGKLDYVSISSSDQERNTFGIYPLDEKGILRKERLLRLDVFEDKDLKLSVFEEPAYIHGWLDENDKLNRLEMNRYGLNFLLKEEQGEKGYYSSEYKSFRISKEQKVSNLSFLNHFLLLENEKKERKVLIPFEIFNKDENSEVPFFPKLTSWRSNFSHLAIDLNEKGEPIHLDQKKALYLSYLALIGKDYENAYKYLKITENCRTQEAPEYFDLFIRGYLEKDMHPKALALRLRAGLLALKQLRYTKKSSDLSVQKEVKHLLQRMTETYRKYHNSDRNAGTLAINPEEERALLTEFFRERLLDKSHFSRLLYLQTGAEQEPIEGSGSMQGITNEGLELDDSNEWRRGVAGVQNACQQCKFDEGMASLEKTSLTRPNVENFLSFFIFVCQRMDAVQSDESLQKEVWEYLNYSKWYKNFPVVFLNQCLRDIFRRPQLYKEHLKKLEGMKSWNYLSWIGELGEIFIENYQKKEKEKENFRVINRQLPLHSESPPVSPKAEPHREGSLLDGMAVEDILESHPLERKTVMPDMAPGVNEMENFHIKKFNQNKEKFYHNGPSYFQSTLKVDLEELKDKLEGKISKAKSKLEKVEAALLDRANALPKDEEAAFMIELEKKGGERKELNLDDLIYLLLRGSEEEILKNCPGLNGDKREAEKLMKDLSAHLVNTTLQQQRENTLEIVKALKHLEEKKRKIQNELNAEGSAQDILQRELEDLNLEFDNLVNELRETMSEKREYKIKEHPELLVFEYKTKMLIRKKNIEVLSKLFAKNGADPKETEVIIQLIMGAGKSKVLLPLLAMMNADGHKLPIVIVPPSLLETNREDLKVTSKSSLCQEPVVFEFDRSTPFTEEELQNKLFALQDVILNRSYVVTTPESLLSAKLKYREILELCDKGMMDPKEAEPKMAILKEIITLFAERGWAVLDEADTLLDIRRELNFPIGEVREIPKERTLLIQKIYEVLLAPEMEKLLHLKANKPAGFEEAVFKKEIAPKIVEHLLSLWNLEKLNKEQLIQYLLGNLEESQLEGLEDHPDRKMIALAKELITNFLPTVLTKQGNTAFGLSHISNKKYPIPYKAKDTPDEKAEFGNIYETLLYAANIYVQEGIKKSQVEEMILIAKSNIRKESKELDVDSRETPAYKEFCRIFKVKDLYTITEEEISAMSKSVIEDREALEYWLNNYVYPEIQTTNQKINANALTLVEMLGHIQGFTGTPYNRCTYHSRLNKPEREDELSSPEDEMKIMDAIYRQIGQVEIPVIDSKTSEEAMKEIIDNFEFDCLIEAGALSSGMSNEKVAEMMRVSPQEGKVKGTIHFNERNELEVLLSGESSPIPLGELSSMEGIRTYYDQRHTTGTDIKQRPTAKALLTYCDNTVRDIAQAVMRMRKLLTSQRIEIVIPKEVAQKIKPEGGDVLFEDLHRYALMRQVKKLGKDMVHATKMKMRHILLKEADALGFEEKEFLNEIKLHHFFSKAVIETFTDDPYLEFGQTYNLEDSIKVLSDYLEEEKRFVDLLFDPAKITLFPLETQKKLIGVKEKIISELNEFTLPSLEMVPPQIPNEGSSGAKNESQVEVEKELELENEIEVEMEQQVMLLHNTVKYYDDWFWQGSTPTHDLDFFAISRKGKNEHCPKVVDMNSCLAETKRVERFEGLFDKEFCTTRNFLETLNNQREIVLGRNSQKKGYQLLFVVEPDGSCKGLLLDPFEAGMFRSYLKMDEVQRRKLLLIDLETGCSEAKKGTEMTEEEEKKLRRLRIQAKFFNGELDYTKGEREILKEWIEEGEKTEYKLLFEVILSNQPHAQEHYKKSWMKKYLEEAA